MLPDKTERSVLIVSSSAKGSAFITEQLEKMQNQVSDAPRYAENAGEARRILISEGFDIVIINAPLSDETGHELALNAAENTSCAVVLLVKNDIFDQTCYRVEDYGVFTAAKPLTGPFFYQIMKLVIASRFKVSAMERENKRLLVKIEEIRIVNRAKWALIEYLKMSEEQAHKYIERQAMDMRMTKSEVAENILRMYEADRTRDN